LRCEQWLGGPVLPPDEQEDRGGGYEEGPEHERVRPAQRTTLDQSDVQTRQEEDHQDLTGWIKSPVSGGPGFGNEPGCQDDRGHGDGDVEPEDRAPGDQVHEQAPDRWPQGHGNTDHAAPDTERPGAGTG